MKTGTVDKVLDIEALSFSYEKKIPILRGISLTAFSGENIGLIGANGAGKSTFLKLLVGLELHFSGSIEVAGHSMCAKELPHIREHVGYVFQDSDSQLFMSTVEEDVAFGPENYGLSQEEVSRRVENALRRVHIEHIREKQVYKLSGGEKKLAAIATILSMEPDLILMDEPSVALDPRNRRNLISIVNEIPSTKLIASHDLDFIRKTCHRTVLLYDGQIHADGPTEEVLENEALLESCGL